MNVNNSSGLEHASAPSNSHPAARLAASSAPPSSSASGANVTPMNVGAFSSDVSDALRFADQMQMGRPRDEQSAAEHESASKRFKAETSQQLYGNSGQTLNDGIGNNNASAAGLYNNNSSMAALMGGNAFQQQQQQQQTGANSNNSSQMDYNLFLQSMPTTVANAADNVYTSLPTSMMMMMGNNNSSNQQQQIQPQHLQFLNQQRQYAVSIAAAAQRGMTVMQQQQLQQQQHQQQLQQQQLQKQQQAQQQAQLQLQKQQQVQAQAGMMTAMRIQQQQHNNSNNSSLIPGTTLPVNIHAASLMAPHQQQQQQQSAWHAMPTAVPEKPVVVDERCLICKEKGNVFTCNGGCGLHVHIACVGEETLSASTGTKFNAWEIGSD